MINAENRKTFGDIGTEGSLTLPYFFYQDTPLQAHPINFRLSGRAYRAISESSTGTFNLGKWKISSSDETFGLMEVAGAAIASNCFEIMCCSELRMCSCCVYDSVWVCWYSLAYLQLWSLSLVEFFRLSNAFIENENKWVFFIPKDWNERDKFAILSISGLSPERDHSNGNCIPDCWWAREIIGVEIFCRCVERKKTSKVLSSCRLGLSRAALPSLQSIAQTFGTSSGGYLTDCTQANLYGRTFISLRYIKMRERLVSADISERTNSERAE